MKHMILIKQVVKQLIFCHCLTNVPIIVFIANGKSWKNMSTNIKKLLVYNDLS